MDESIEPKQDGHRYMTTARVIGMLFGKDKKPVEDDSDVSDFLHGQSDKLHMTGTAPPKLPKLDTSKASRWPTAAEINRLRDTSRGRSVSLKRGKKGLNVRFTDTQPEIIGEGGDEAESPTWQISERKRSNSHPTILQRPAESRNNIVNPVHGSNDKSLNVASYEPPNKMQTRQGTISEDIKSLGRREIYQDDGSGSDLERPAASTESHSMTSFAARVQADMRRAEGEAFRRASRVLEEPIQAQATDPSFQTMNAGSSHLSSHPGLPLRVPLPLTLFPGGNRPGLSGRRNSVESHPSWHDPNPSAPTLSDGQSDALDDFLSRVQHLFKLFQLSAESVMPLGMSRFEALIKAASWWFLKGKSKLEIANRSRPSSSDSQQSYSIPQQQAHTDIAKSLWIMTSVIVDRPEYKMQHTRAVLHRDATTAVDGDEKSADIIAICQTITTNLRELAAFMRRQNMLPPPVEEAMLPQGLDNTIWISYPPVPPDAARLLSYGRPYSMDASVNSSLINLCNAMPLTDTGKVFVYTRLFIDLFLLKEGVDSAQNKIPCIIFVSRAQTETDLKITITSQNEIVSLCITSNKARGPTWNDVQWQSRISAMDVRLPKGFIARLQCSPNDFKTVWNMYDYTIKIHASLSPRRDERVIFEDTVKIFQYFDRDRQSRIFPKEPISQCLVRVFEKRITKSAGIRPRSMYQGFRIAVITGTKTKSLSGISHDFFTSKPLQYGFMRGEGEFPALLLKFDDGAKKPTMVFTFADEAGRSRLHSCITSGAIENEVVLAHVPIKSFSVSTLDSPNAMTTLNNFEWQGLRVVNGASWENSDPDHTSTILSNHLRVIMDSKSASLVDHINIEPGELQLHLSTHLSMNAITVIRQEQEDITISLLESQMLRDMPQEISHLLELFSKAQTLRKYTFLNIKDLHLFQAAVTGFEVLFDGLAHSLIISRRRTVVSLSKKWEATPVRVQVLRRDKTVQMAAFFDDFGYGECMNFVLKMTDNFESFIRNGKSCIRIVDAKFAMPIRKEGKPEGISLDMPEYASEHDDVTVSFDSDLDQDRFAKALPAPVKAVSRLGTIKR